MKLTKSKRDHSLGFNMTPMIDIVFLLIIFFMTVSQITRTSEIPLDLPKVQQGGSESKPTTVTINIKEDGSLLMNGATVELSRVRELVLSAVADADSDVSKVRIQIRCDRRAQSKRVNQLCKDLSELGFNHVKVAVTTGAGGE